MGNVASLKKRSKKIKGIKSPAKCRMEYLSFMFFFWHTSGLQTPLSTGWIIRILLLSTKQYDILVYGSLLWYAPTIYHRILLIYIV